MTDEEIRRFMVWREYARRSGDTEEVDSVRVRMERLGVVIEDAPGGGVSWYRQSAGHRVVTREE